MTPIIKVNDLHRAYGTVHAVDGLSFEIEAGRIVGFIGANGAGKTTTMRIMATLELPSSGVVEVCGYDVMNAPSEVRHRIGWMPDSYGTYTHMTVYEYLDFYGRAFGYKGDERRSRIDEVMDFTDLHVLADRDMNKLSKGMGQRLCLGRALLNDPEILILDEPAAGLDPKARIEFIRLVRLLAKDGKTVFISSHILSELGEMCDYLLFIDQGRLIHEGTADSLAQRQGGGLGVQVHVQGDVKVLLDWVAVNPGVRLFSEVRQGARLVFDDDDPDDLAAHLRKMILDGVPVTEFHRERRRLEDAFVSIVSENGGPPPLPGGPVI